MAISRLILKWAKVSHPSGQWRDDDYDVICQGAVVGRVLLSPGAPADKPWMWTLAYGHHEEPHSDAWLRGMAQPVANHFTGRKI